MEHSSPEDLVDCHEHGPQPATFVCQHVVTGLEESRPSGFWWADNPANDRPDAWCTSCNDMVARDDGEWNERSEAVAGVRLLCGMCYDRARAMNLGRPDRKWWQFWR